MGTRRALVVVAALGLVAVGSPVPSSGQEAVRTVTVTPDAALVHDQVVVVRGTGWGDRRPITVGQCIAGATTGRRDCAYAETGDLTDAAGRFRADLTVSVLLETTGGTYDCRVDACVVRALDAITEQTFLTAPIAFDPVGPDPVRRTATVTPDTGLVDGQRVGVVADGFTGELEDDYIAETVQCRTPVLALADCDASTNQYEFADGAGHVDFDAELFAVLQLDGGGTHDCRTGGCVLAVRSAAEALFDAALVPLAFDPVGPLRPPPTAVGSPITDLHDGDVVQVSGAGWPARKPLVLQQCLLGVAGDEDDDCNYWAFSLRRATPGGDLDGAVAVRVTWSTYDGRQIDCRLDACAVVVSGVDDDLRRGVQIPLAFDPDGAVLSPSIDTLTPTTGLQDGDVVDLTGSGGRPNGEVHAIQCIAEPTTAEACDYSGSQPIRLPGPGLLRSRPEGGTGGLSFTARFTVRAELDVFGVGGIDCRQVACVVALTDGEQDFEIVDQARIRFGPPVVDPVAATPPFTG